MGGMSTGVRPLESGLVVFILPGVVCKWFLILATVGNKPIIHLGSGENRAMRKAAIQIPSPVYFAQSLEFWVPIAAIGHPTNINTTHSTAQYTALQHAIQRPILDDGTFSMPSTGILIPYLCKERDLSVLRSTMDDVWETKGSALETDSSTPSPFLLITSVICRIVSTAL